MEDEIEARGAGSRGAMIAGGALLLLLLVALGGALLWSTREQEREKSPEGVEALLLQDPVAAPLYRSFKASWPEEFAVFRDRVSDQLRRGVRKDVIAREGFAWMRRAAEAHVPQLVQAPHDRLAAYNQAEIALLDTLEREDIMLCARYATTGFRPGDDLTPAARERLVAMAVTQLEASAAGRDHPAGRTIPEILLTADSDALVAAMRREGMSQADFEVWTDENRMAAAEPWRQCAIGRYLLRAIASLSPERSDRLLGWILRQRPPG